MTAGLLLVALCAGTLMGCGGEDTPVSPEPTPDPPSVTSSITDMQMLADDDPAEVDLGGVFSDPNGGSLSFAAESSNSNVVDVSVSGATLTVAPVGGGEADVTVTAQNDGGTVDTSFRVEVTLPDPPDRPPSDD